jgi:nitrate/nitrite transport system substrate-binding protein
MESLLSTFDDPFDPNRPLVRACSCGRHRSQAEHDATERALQPAAIVTDDQR